MGCPSKSFSDFQAAPVLFFKKGKGLHSILCLEGFLMHTADISQAFAESSVELSWFRFHYRFGINYHSYTLRISC